MDALKLRKKFWLSLELLLIFIFIGFLICIGFSFALIYSGQNAQDSSSLQILQWMQNIFVMILPALGLCWIWKQDIGQCMHLNTAPVKSILLTILSIVVASPLLEALTQLNQSIHFSGPLLWLDDYLALEMERNTAVMDNLLSASDTAFGFLALFLLVSIATAIGEETMFRGAILNLLQIKNQKRLTLAIVSGLIFSLIHFDFYGLIPRFILGVYLAYLLFWSQSLWVPIAAHATNNLLALVQYRLCQAYPNFETDFSITALPIWAMILVLLASTGLTSWVILSIKKRQTSMPLPISHQ